MDCKFHVGQKVVCINTDSDAFRTSVLPAIKLQPLHELKVGKVYVIESIEELNDPLFTTTVSIVLVGIIRYSAGRFRVKDQGFDFRRFAPLEELKDEDMTKTDISIFKRMCDRKYTKEEIRGLLKEEKRFARIHDFPKHVKNGDKK